MRTSFKMEDKYITMIRGDTLSFNFELLDENKQPFTQDIEAAYFTCKSNNVNEQYAFQKSLNDGITRVDTGVYLLRVSPEETKDLENGKYYYDLQIGVNGDIYTPLKGILEIEQDITY